MNPTNGEILSFASELKLYFLSFGFTHHSDKSQQKQLFDEFFTFLVNRP
jgi:hypothetical protein